MKKTKKVQKQRLGSVENPKNDDKIGIGGAVVSTFVPFGNFIYWAANRNKYPNAADSALNLGLVGTIFFIAAVSVGLSRK